MSENITRGLLIGGQEVAAAGGGVTADISPWTGEPYAQVAAGTPADVTAAIDAAQAAFPAWSAMGAYDRRDILLRAADLMAAREERRSPRWPARSGPRDRGPPSTWPCAWRSCARPPQR
jgi:Aldehyde dehydrogenase family